MRSRVFFADDGLKAAYKALKGSKVEDRMLHEWITRAIGDLEEDAFCGIQVPKRQIPRDYVRRYHIDNLWKYDLPRGWRLIYSVAHDGVVIITIVLEWFDHKGYERRFGY